MAAYITLMYCSTILIGVAALSLNIFAAKKGMFFRTDWVGEKTFTAFIAVFVLLNTSDFLNDYFFKSNLYGQSLVVCFISTALWPFGYYCLIRLAKDACGKEHKDRIVFFFVVAATLLVAVEFVSFYQAESISPALYSNIRIGVYSISGLAALGYCAKKIYEIKEISSESAKRISVYCMIFMTMTAVNVADEVLAWTVPDYPVIMDVIYIGCWLAVSLYSLLVLCKDCEKTKSEIHLGEFCEAYGLTGREAEIVMAIYEGKRITQIATDLGLSENTVRVHSSRLYKKLDVEDRVQAANKIREALKRG